MVTIYALIDPRTEEVHYVGKSRNPTRRWSGARGRSLLRDGPAGRWVLGLHALGLEPRIRILEQCEDKATARARESWWMERFWWRGEPLLNVYSCEGPGAVISPMSSLGDEYREKLSAANKRRLASPETREKLLAALARGRTGRKPSAETRARMSASLRGRTRSPEHCAKLSAAMLGRKRSVETRAKISAAHLGRKYSVEARAHMSAAQLGRKRSAEACAKMSAAGRGRKKSAEHRARISAGLRSHYAKL